jgi:hypothetical protein
LTGETWRAVAYAVVALFAFLVLLAIYFWGAMLFGGLLEAVGRRATPVPWSVAGAGEVPEHDIDPGLELMAAGVLVYRLGEVKPRPHFRQIPLTNAHAIRPFVVARTGADRPYAFEFVLSDAQDSVRYHAELVSPLKDAPQIVMPHARLRVTLPKRLSGQRWNLQVRSGVTIVTTLRFVFVDGSAESDPGLDWQRTVLPRLLDDAIKQDVLLNTQEVVLEDL